MKINRRDCFRAGALAGAGAVLSGCSRGIYQATGPAMPRVVSLPDGPVDPITRLLNRAGFGPTPGQVRQVSEFGVERWLDDQLHASGADNWKLRARLHGKEAFTIGAMELRDVRKSRVLMQLQQAALLRAILSPFQLHERMVDFWTNHFSIYAPKGLAVNSPGAPPVDGTYFKPLDETRVVRAHALGKFPEMLRASAHSPAMLGYLDNQVNKTGKANENYARELMELHTLGVHGGYTQKDVQEVARCLTGWTVENRSQFGAHVIESGAKVARALTGYDFRAHGPSGRGAFRFDPAQHDNGPKTVLGHPILPVRNPAELVYYKPLNREIPAGQLAGEKVLEILSMHPSTAQFISAKLARYFLGDSPEASGAVASWTDRLSTIYLNTGGDIQQMIRPLLLSEEVASGPPMLKRPFDYVVSSLRAVNANTDGGPHLQSYLSAMGQPLYQWPMPDGYPDKTVAWTGSLLARWNFALALAAGNIKGTTADVTALVQTAGATTDAECADALVGIILGRKPESESAHPLAEKLRAHMAKTPRHNDHPVLAEATALALASPEFQWR